VLGKHGILFKKDMEKFLSLKAAGMHGKRRGIRSKKNKLEIRSLRIYFSVYFFPGFMIQKAKAAAFANENLRETVP